jgi:glycosyltransferase involved in cell wall biosynthesis
VTRIAISTLIVRPGKVGSNEPYLVNLLRGLAAIDSAHEYVLFVTAANEHLFRGLGGRFRLIKLCIGGNRPLRIACDQFLVPFLATRAGAEVLHYPGTVGSVVKRKRLTQVVTIHYDIGDEHLRSISALKKAYYGAFMWRSRAIVKAMIVPSRGFAVTFGRRWRVAPENIRVVHHGVAAEPHPPSPERDRSALARLGVGGRYVLSVTTALPHKNPGALLAAYGAWAVIRGDGVPQLILAGRIAKADIARWLAECRARGVSVPEAKVLLTGFLAADDLNALYRNAVCLALPTLTESFSMPVVEAMAAGCPVVASDIEVHREVAGDAAVLVDPNATAAFVAELDRLLVDDVWRRGVVARGLQRAARFSWEECARRTELVYEFAHNDD